MTGYQLACGEFISRFVGVDRTVIGGFRNTQPGIEDQTDHPEAEQRRRQRERAHTALSGEGVSEDDDRRGPGHDTDDGGQRVGNELDRRQGGDIVGHRERERRDQTQGADREPAPVLHAQLDRPRRRVLQIGPCDLPPVAADQQERHHGREGGRQHRADESDNGTEEHAGGDRERGPGDREDRDDGVTDEEDPHEARPERVRPVSEPRN